MAVQTISVADDESGLRLDRWFRRRFPTLPHGRLEKLLRRGQIRVDGARVRANIRLEAGQSVRVPPLRDRDGDPKPGPKINRQQADAIRRCVLYRDLDTIVINKPAGLAVQGGSRLSHHLDGMLDALKFDASERPRLIHRLDKDTSGVLVLARNARSASRLATAFRGSRPAEVVLGARGLVSRPSCAAQSMSRLPKSRRGASRRWLQQLMGGLR